MERTEFGGTKNKSITINQRQRRMEGRGQEGSAKQQTPGEGEEFLKDFKTSFDYVLRFVLNDRQTTIQNLPTEIIDFKRADVVELRDPAKNLIRFYIDRRHSSAGEDAGPAERRRKIREEQYANWHKFQGVMTPLFVSRTPTA